MTYNGHPNWSQWNVALWIANDEGLYNMAREYIRGARRERASRESAAEEMLSDLNVSGITHTPDGARYTKTSILHAMRGLE